MISLLSSTPAAGVRTSSNSPSRTTSAAEFEIALARAEAAKTRETLAANHARNAQAIADFASHGLTLTQHSFSEGYVKQRVANVDTDGDQLISKSELAAQLGDAAPADSVSKLYAALDSDGDGRLTTDELMDSLPDPTRLPAFRNELVNLTGHGKADPAAIGALYRQQFEQYDASTVLRGLAQRINTPA